MSEYEYSLAVRAAPDEVFQFVSDPDNLARYLPTVHEAKAQPGERLRVKGEAAGHFYDSDGFYHVNADERRMEWGSDGENRYRGWLQVMPTGGDAQVTVHLSFEPRPDQERQFEAQTGDRDVTIHQGLVDALHSVKNLCEGGGKVQLRAINR
ncbi:MAG: SRPBCC family protein [Gammaproteobacteria bacterium]